MGGPVSGANARFNTPKGIDCDKDGNVYVADTGNNQIRKINVDGRVSVLAGDPNGASGFSGGADGLFDSPQDVSVLNGNIYVADTGNSAIRIVRNGIRGVYTIAGDGTKGDEVGSSPKFSNPTSMAVAPDGSLFINDTGNYKIKRYSSKGVVSNFSGGTRGNEFGQGVEAQYYDLQFIISDGRDGAYVVDYDRAIGSRLIYIDALGKNHLVHQFDDLPVSGMATKFNGQLYVCVSDVREDLYDIGNLIIGDDIYGVIQ